MSRDPSTIIRDAQGKFDKDAARPEPAGTLRNRTPPLVRLARQAVQSAALPQSMTGEPDTDAQFCSGVAKHITMDMGIRKRRPRFERTADGSMLAQLELGPRGRPYTVRISDGRHVTVRKLSQDQRNNPYELEPLATNSFEIIGDPATPAQMAGMIVEAFEQTRWWQ